MKHRLVDSVIGFGSLEGPELTNNIKLKECSFWEEFLKDFMAFKLIREHSGFDFELTKNGFKVGIEASYQYEDTLIINFDFDSKGKSSIRQGRAWGAYGSQCTTKLRFYSEYKMKDCKFVKFIDKWWEKLKKRFEEGFNELLSNYKF